MFPDSSFDVSYKRSAWALQNSPYQDWKLPTQWSLPQDSFQELSVPGLNWIIIQTLPILPASRIWIISNRELSLKDAPDPSQQMNPKLWQRHRVSTGTPFPITTVTYLWMTRMPNRQNRQNSTVFLGVFMGNTQYHSIYCFFPDKIINIYSLIILLTQVWYLFDDKKVELIDSKVFSNSKIQAKQPCIQATLIRPLH